MTTIETITTKQIRALRAEAKKAGDEAQVTVCNDAVAGDRAALAKCVRVISDAEAQ